MTTNTSRYSNGFLPLAALTDEAPTAVGVWDLEEDAGIQVRGGWSPAGDQLILARLHRQPLAILHLDAPPGPATEGEQWAALWREGRENLIAHVSSHGCLPLPTGPDELRAALRASDAACPARTPQRPRGPAAVILCTVGRTAELSRCLQSLSRMPVADVEIIVVDNRPAVTGTRAVVEGFVSEVPVRYVAEPRVGLAAARNAGVAAADGAAYVAFTDDDVEVDPEWLNWLLAPFAQPAVHAVTGLVLPMALQSPAQKRFERYAGFGKGVRAAVYDNGEHRAPDRFLYPYWGGMFGSGNSMAFRRDVLLRLGGFDPALGAGTPTGGGEDLAAFTDVILHRGQIVYEPRSLCWHEHRADEAALEAQVRSYGIGLTAVFWRYLWRDWGFARTAVRSLPQILRLIRRRSEDRQGDALPGDLAALESRGRLIGPWRYVASRRAQAGR